MTGALVSFCEPFHAPSACRAGSRRWHGLCQAAPEEAIMRSHRIRRLELNRETVRHLKRDDLNAVGGAGWGGQPEPSFFIYCPTISGAVFTCCVPETDI